MSNLPTDPAARQARLIRHLLPWLATVCCGHALAASVHPRVLENAAANNSVDVLLVYADQATPSFAPLRDDGDARVRRRHLVEALKSRAGAAQHATRSWLDARGIAHRDFWIANMIQARVPRGALAELAARADIARIDPNPAIALHLPPAESDPGEAYAGAVNPVGIAWGVAKIEAPLVWQAGHTGEGVVIGGEDTGYQWDHPVLKPQYRGWNGTSADHNYNWHDSIHDSTGNACGNDSPFPCDDNSHGTHTAGTFAGDDGMSAAIVRHQVGVAPGARWIGCRNMDADFGTPARYIECMQWMLEPTDLNDANPKPDLAPDIVSNSWQCPKQEGCTTGLEIQGAVDNLVAAGIFYAAAAGNDGSSCETVLGAPAIYDSSFVVGATNASDALAGFSSRGPVPGSALVRPDISAPGVNVCSSIPTNSYACWQGTSMATPHVAGAAALLMSAFPALKGHPESVAQILRATATTQGIKNTTGIDQSCGGTPITQWPNYMVGYGRLDAWSAVQEVVFIDAFDP